MEKITDQLARDVARACDASRFDWHSYNAKACAQRNLTGRSHYCDDDTLKYFHSRIQSARPECHGLVLIIVESAAADYKNTSRGFRFVAFDLFGAVINDRGEESPLHKKSDKACAEAAAWLESFDVLAHYRAEMLERAESMERRATDMRNGALMLTPVKV